MGKLKRQMIGILLCGSIMLNACSNGAVEEDRGSRLSVKETVQSTMESLKELDLERFNEYTDNYVETYHNWIGIPVEREYRVFVEELAESAVVLNMRCYFAQEVFWEEKWRMTENAKLALDEAGIEIAYPQLDVHMK